MRTDVKVGIIVGLVVFGGGIIFVLNQGREPADDAADLIHLSETPPAEPQEVSDTKADKRPGLTERSPLAPKRKITAPDATPTPRPTTPEVATPSPTEEQRSGFKPNPLTRPPTSDPPRESGPLALGPTDSPTGPAVSTPNTPLRPSDDERPTRRRATTQAAARSASDAGLQRERPRRSIPHESTPIARRSKPPTDDDRAADEPLSRTPRLPRRTGPTYHTIVAGDSLWQIAERYYGDGTQWKRIKDANPNLDEGRMAVGQRIVIPSKDAAGPPAADPKPRVENKPKKIEARQHTYVVEKGDTLTSIARNVLKDGLRWREIYELNKAKIPNPDMLTVGLELHLPKD